MVCLGFKPGAAGWWVQTKPWSHEGRLSKNHFLHNYVYSRSGIVSRDVTLEFQRVNAVPVRYLFIDYKGRV